MGDLTRAENDMIAAIISVFGAGGTAKMFETTIRTLAVCYWRGQAATIAKVRERLPAVAGEAREVLGRLRAEPASTEQQERALRRLAVSLGVPRHNARRLVNRLSSGPELSPLAMGGRRSLGDPLESITGIR